MKIINVVGTRPNFIKIAPVMEQMLIADGIEPLLLHTGQHYDSNMNQVFFDQLGIPRPDIDLGVGSGTLSSQLAEIIKLFDPILEKENPDAVLVVGDVSSTVACALAASYRRIPIIHVEAGLRSFDMDMPEEINRLVTDRLSDLLFTTESCAAINLQREGVDSRKIHFVGNVMVDTLLKHRKIADETSDILTHLKLEKRNYAVMTLHRPSNVDHMDVLTPIMKAIAEISTKIKIIFAMHPRTKKMMREFGLDNLLNSITIVEPQSYLDMLKLMNNAKMVLTDSGGMQEETSVLAVPCLTIRKNTERPVTVDEGSNTLVGTEGKDILKAADEIFSNGGKSGRCPDLWDGCAAKRIVNIIKEWDFHS
ncbi:MAG: non-hydrolyzing UDP-N-acetylglucosamine 2-epimerase [Nitrospinales bacterium]